MTVAQREQIALLRATRDEPIMCPPDPEDGSVLVLAARSDERLELLSVECDGVVRCLTPAV